MTKYLTTAEAAAKAAIPPNTLLRWLRQGRVREPRRDHRGQRMFTEQEATVIASHARTSARLNAQSTSIERLRAADWSFSDSNTSYLTHSIHPYPAKFIPQIPNLLIRELSSIGDTVADIFCGSGTTLLEALTLQRHAIGVDANPLASLIAQVKTTQLQETSLSAIFQHRLACERLIELINLRTHSTSNHTLPFISTGWRPNRKVCDTWFEPYVVEELAELKSQIDKLSDNIARNLCYMTFSAIIVAVSRQDSDTRYVRRTKAISPGDTVKRYVRHLDSARAAVEKLSNAIPQRVAGRVLTANVLDSPVLPKFNLLVTSPPYPNAFSYHLYHGIRLHWLGYDPSSFKKIEIGSHRKYSAKGSGRATPATFASEMSIILDWLHKHLCRHGFACLVIGDSKIAGEHVDNASILAEQGMRCGFRELARIDRPIPATRKALNPKFGRISTEKILILQRV